MWNAGKIRHSGTEVIALARQRRHKRPTRRRGRFSGLYKVLSVLLAAGAVIAACIVFFRVNTIEVSGNVRYTVQEVIDASGVKTGDNLIALPGGRVSASIRAQLPYVEGVTLQRAYPDRLVIRVTERVAAASVDSAEGRWLISAQGKLLEKDNGSIQTIQIAGMTAVGPYAGGMLQTAEEESLTLDYVKQLLTVLEQEEMLGQCTALDCTAAASMTLHYGIYRLKLPRGGDYGYYIQLARSALSAGLEKGLIQEGQGGLLDLTVMDGKAHFRSDQS